MQDRIVPGAAGWLNLAAAPTFGLMALFTVLLEDGQMAALCSQAGPPSPLAGMAPMYLLMAIFHLPPWFRLTAKLTFDKMHHQS